MTVPRCIGWAVGVLAWWMVLAMGCSPSGGGGRSGGGTREEERVAAIRAEPAVRRSLELRRTFSGALEAADKVVVAPKVGGRIERLTVDLADPVSRNQVVALLDAAEFAQDERQAEAELAVAEANRSQAANALEISRRENGRIELLRERGIASDAEHDVARADLMQKESQVQVAEAQIRRAAAVLESARIRHGYTRVTADWSEGDRERRVAERYVDEGQTVSANEPLFLIVQLDPILAVISVVERDYSRLQAGLEARVETDAFPGEVFVGRIERVAPVFRATSRQARVEVALSNPDQRLKPGMFVRVTLVLDGVEDVLAVPSRALARRDGREGIFVVVEPGDRVAWQPARTGLEADGWIEWRGPTPSGPVVTLGQHLIDDGSRVRVVPEDVVVPEAP
ncbi:MAG: efflux RND transporter periplasmic adaptor subunit [Verrucomicrobiae bacterium]|nr:efflux RND transporter periplasmic adaptor subunit [Verrucomicrobiae bacterium]